MALPIVTVLGDPACACRQHLAVLWGLFWGGFKSLHGHKVCCTCWVGEKPLALALGDAGTLLALVECSLWNLQTTMWTLEK